MVLADKNFVHLLNVRRQEFIESSFLCYRLSHMDWIYSSYWHRLVNAISNRWKIGTCNRTILNRAICPIWFLQLRPNLPARSVRSFHLWSWAFHSRKFGYSIYKFFFLSQFGVTVLRIKKHFVGLSIHHARSPSFSWVSELLANVFLNNTCGLLNAWCITHFRLNFALSFNKSIITLSGWLRLGLLETFFKVAFWYSDLLWVVDVDKMIWCDYFAWLFCILWNLWYHRTLAFINLGIYYLFLRHVLQILAGNLLSNWRYVF